jgi:hypothetical protein
MVKHNLFNFPASLRFDNEKKGFLLEYYEVQIDQVEDTADFLDE